MTSTNASCAKFLFLALVSQSIGFAALAEEPVICQAASAAVRELSLEEQAARAIGDVKTTHQAKVLDGMTFFGSAGLVFDSRAKEERAQGSAVPLIVPWAKADVQIMKSKESPEQLRLGQRNPIRLFVQRDVAPYNNPDMDRGTNGGIYRIQAADVMNGVQCPTEPLAYDYHFFPKADLEQLQAGDVFCIRTRDGERYALMRIDVVCGEGLVFSYRYNGSSPKFIADLKFNGAATPSERNSTGVLP